MSNLAQFRTSVSDYLGLDNDVLTEQPDMDIWINRGVERVLMDTGCYVTAESITVSGMTSVTSLSGTVTDYLMPVEIMEITQMYLVSSGTGYKLRRVSVPDLVDARRLSLPTGSPTSMYALAGANLLMFWPAPAATDVIEMYYIPVPTALSQTGDDPSSLTLGGIPKQLHKAIEYWACSEGADYDDDQTSAQGQRYRDDYDKEIVRYKKFLRLRGGLRNQRAVVNGGGRRAFHTNDIYVSGR